MTSQLRGPCIVGPQNKMATLVPSHFLILQTMPENRIRKHAPIACTVGKMHEAYTVRKSTKPLQNLHEVCAVRRCAKPEFHEVCTEFIK